MEEATGFNIDVDHGQLLHSLEKIHKIILPCDEKRFTKVLRLWETNQLELEKLVNVLSEMIVNSNYTIQIKSDFHTILFLIVTKRFSLEVKTNILAVHQEECICLSKLIDHSVHVSNHALQYFKLNRSPFSFESIEDSNRKLKKRDHTVSNLDVVKCCYNFLKTDYNFYKNAWKWSEFLTKFHNNGCDLQKLYCNYIIALLTGMSLRQLNALNENLPKKLILENQIVSHKFENIYHRSNDENSSTNLVPSTFHSDVVCCIEGVILPIYNLSNKKFYQFHDVAEKIVNVSSTKTNMRSIALGISSEKAICLTGPVGCGKTSLAEHLAKLTGRIAPSSQVDEMTPTTSADVPTKDSSKVNSKSLKRGSDDYIESDNDVQKMTSNNGFLRIQLGDQTDSKMLLGQYRCTDVPGEFVWQPGVLTQAVMNGQWLLLEDIDSATQDVTTVLTNLMESRYLSVPGFRDCVRIAPGFQLFVTLRNQKLTNHAQQSNFQILEKYLYIINMLPLSRSELCNIITINYPKLSTISDRIVDVYLEFSKGMHQQEIEESSNSMDVSIVPIPPTEKVTLAGLSNSNRLVSTRDLFKLCKRSHPTFSVTSTECAYNVFQNAVDLFCSYLPHGTAKTQLITNIGAKLGIIQSRCEFYANEYKPEVLITGIDIKCGRVQVDRRLTVLNTDKHVESKRNADGSSLGESAPQKKKKIDKTSYLNVYQESKNKAPTFSFTRLAACILEKIAVGVTHNEPVLLVGETGVGKTSSVQYLAHQTNHKLVVVNMNNQSDVSDLIGGYKPVDLGFVITPMRSEFELLFKKTFISSKNEKFLNNVSVCFNRSDFAMVIKLMLKVCETVFAKKADMIQSVKSKVILSKWSTLRVKLLRLSSQLKHSINISFAFIPGSLVNCIKNGDWVLLDEINLASTETLECLSTILEPDGSIVLLEKGDYVPIQRHADFRIFACMNPSTDIGKKDLSVGIRNRFTEFFVDELTTENDLMILVGDYLNSTGIQKTKVFDIVKLYRKLRTLAQLDLNDGLGNRPVYSLRTLCRSLGICAKNLCGSIERNLYESFCVSFLTQLDQASHKVVQLLIQQALLSNAKAVLGKQIPKLVANSIDFEGYWIQNGQRDILECESYILTASVKENLKDLARIISIGRLPVLLQGPTSAGKTSLIEYVAKRSGNFCLRINNHEHTDLQEYIGTYTSDVSGKLSFKEGVLVQAMRNGFWIILDELNLAPSDILEALNRVLDDNRELFIPETQTLVKAHPNFMLFATQNPPGLYGGRKTLSRAFKNRFIELHFSEIPKDELEVILEKRCLIPKSYAQKMVKTMSELQINRKRTTKGSFTLRDLFRWGNRYTHADPKLMENKTYDWNQHLVDEGFLVLSSRIRNDIEVEIIEKSLFNHFRKKIDLNKLFILDDATSMVTKNILEKLENHVNFRNIVWTFNMKRMAVLVAKAIEFNEPILLVGPTGCGKTTVCQILADVHEMDLKILNCHMHTEGADFLGGLRPFRSDDNQDKLVQKKQLFEWANGPLVTCMLDGTYFLADEISLAEDSVLERLNCILEPERTLLLSEKGGANENIISNSTDTSDEFVIKAKTSFKFFATMNPGGDFGKKELSPALRNRFTEIWCRATESKEDLIKIAAHTLKINFNCITDPSTDMLTNDIGKVIVNTVYYLKQLVDKLNFSIRDILAWVAFITANSDIKEPKALTIYESLYFGLNTLFLDSLEMLPHDTYNEIEIIRMKTTKHLIIQIREHLQKSVKLEDIQAKRGSSIETTDQRFGINPFFVPVCHKGSTVPTDFMFTAPTTQQNLFRLLSALSLNKAVLLEGPPGVGKTSLIENLTTSIGFNIVRINLCEHTDLADLFGTDLPAENKNFENESTESSLGSFIWRDGPLLSALKSENTWILLDELNLAPQSVLEGLNAILDHRGEVFIPELNKTFKLGGQTRIFASQNPLRQGGGRKGLPQSFLNRFTKVYLRKLETKDLLHVVNGKYGWYFDTLEKYFKVNIGHSDNDDEDVSLFDAQSIATLSENFKFDLAERLVMFSEQLDEGISNLEFGHKGGPFEVNLRDILRWCELLNNEKTGFLLSKVDLDNVEKLFNNFKLVMYEKMKLVYYLRMRTDADKAFIRNKFGQVFNCNVDLLQKMSQDISLYWNDDTVYLNDIEIVKSNHFDSTGDELIVPRMRNFAPLLLTSQLEIVKNLAECTINSKPVILCGSTDCGKTKTIDVLCTMLNRNCVVDTIDDSVTGSFQQVDLYRHLEEIAKEIESVLVGKLQQFAVDPDAESFTKFLKLLDLWESYILSLENIETSTSTATSAELVTFKKRQLHLENLFSYLMSVYADASCSRLQLLSNKLKALNLIVKNTVTLNTGGHFEWVDSKIVKSLKYGQYICLEHVNLCSSAVLDRLNPIFEPNGSLLISEKGVSANNEPDVVTKHQNFCAFLTLDPKNGEISRAMRNRCIEMNFNKENYSHDDLKRLIYVNGVKDMCLIDCLLNIHKRLSSVSDFNAFGVSHILKCAFLIAENKRQGCSNVVSIQTSAFEVYVRSSNTDLLGFGLDFYRKRLETEILEEIKCIKAMDNVINYDNIVLKSSELNTLSLIRLQCEVFLSLLRCHETNLLSTDVLPNGFSEFATTSLNVNFENLLYMLFVIYDISSTDDVEQRKTYLEMSLSNLINATTVQKSLQKINNELYQVVIDTPAIKLLLNKKVPWNSKVFPRLRNYQSERLGMSEQLKITAELILNILLKDVVTKNSIKLNQIDVITYSKAVETKTIQDSLRNDFISYVHALLANIPEFIRLYLRNSSINTYEAFTQLICSFLWSDRMYKMTTQQLLKHKKLNENMFDKLVLHFGWLDKHLIEPLMKYCDNDDVSIGTFEKPYSKISTYVESNWHPLNLVRKEYVKKFTNFMPYYEEHQIMLHECIREFSNLVNLVHHIGQYDKEEIMKKIKIIFNETTTKMREFLVRHSSNGLEWFNQEDTTENISLENTDNDLDLNFNSIEESQSIIDTIREKRKSFFEHVDDTTEIDTIALRKLNDLLPVAEYFAMKSSLTTVLNCQCAKYPINLPFFNQINTINVDLFQVLKVTNSEKYKVCEEIWNELTRKYNSMDSCALETIISTLQTDFYKNYSSFYRKITNRLQSFSMNSICVQSDVLKPLEFGTVEHYSYNRSILTNTVLNALLDAQGHLKSSGLGEADIWRGTLSSLSKLIWYNINICNTDFCLEKANYENSLNRATKLTIELNWINDQFSDENPEFFDDFMSIIASLREKITECKSDDLNLTNTYNDRFVQHYESSIINVLIGSIEVNLLSFMPIIDPVEKNRLKKLYNEEDANHIKQILTAYDAFKVIMNYQNLGEEMLEHLRSKLMQIEKRKEKFSKKVALRPNECMYGDLVRDVNHFLGTCCHPKILNSLIASAEKALSNKLDYTSSNSNKNTFEHLQNVEEVIKKIDLWMNNAQQFKHHTLSKYSAFYQDFLTPIESSITTLNFGFVGLQSCLIRSRDSICVTPSGSYFDVNNGDEFARLVGQLVEFPSAKGLDVLPSHTSISTQNLNITTVLNQLPNYDECYFKVIKSKLYEVRNIIEISKRISNDSFSDYDSILNICNMIWMEEEEAKRKKLAEEESLYVHKTRCETEDEEEVILEEIQKMFPTDVDNDFGEFIQSDSLEKIVKKSSPRKINKSSDVLSYEDMKLLCTSFIDIMQNFSRCYYYKPEMSVNTTKDNLDFITPYKINVSVFNQLLKKYKSCLNTKMDESVYGGLGLIIGISQQSNDFLQVTDKLERIYDFYRDSNITEILGSTEVLCKIEKRANDELEVWPDHAVLIDMIRIIHRIRSLPLTSSVVRFSTGFQLLRQKLDEWNKLAHKGNHMKELEIAVAQHIQRWTKLELQFWRECLTQSYDKMQFKGCKYWFFIYNLVHEYLRDPQNQFASCNLTDIKSIEKCFGTDDVINDPEMKTNKRLKSNDVIDVLKQFIESSNFAEFSLRMSLLKSFEQYLHYSSMQSKRRDILIQILHNLCLYYEQFRVRIVDRIKAIKTPIEKKLKEFVKIESYNKDLSYFSMKNNIARVHRNLHKFLKEFETLLNEKISSVFQLKDNLNMDLTIDSEKGKKSSPEDNVTHYMVDVKYFLASKLHEQIVIDPAIDLTNNLLLSRVSKLFGTSRNIVKQAILHSHFPTLIYNLDVLLVDQIESCEYLRKLEVDRSQIKTKQKVQAKQILSQKRKALSDLYKVLVQLGFNFRTGLMESSLREEIIDLKIQPFCIQTMIFDPRHKKIDQHFSQLVDNLDSYYAKCVFKLKLLQTVLLTPHADLGLQHLERIKGFSVDLYLLIQSQRKDVSRMVRSVYDLQQQIIKVMEVRDCDNGGPLEQHIRKCDGVISWFIFIKESLVKICNVFHQYIILLKCVPTDIDGNYNVFAGQEPFCQSSKLYIRIKELSLSILNKATHLLTDVNHNNLMTFHSNENISILEGKFNGIVDDVRELSNAFKSEQNESMVIASAIFDLLEQIEKSKDFVFDYSDSHEENCDAELQNEEQIESSRRVTSNNHQQTDFVATETIDSELENIIHSILISMQSIYKKYAVKADNLYETHDNSVQSENADEMKSKQNDDLIEENHLKVKINTELLADLEILNISKVTMKLSNILLTIQYSKCREVFKTMRKIVGILPILEQYNLFCKFYLIQQFGAHKISTKMLSVMLTVFVELGAKGFCIPPDLMDDEDGESKQNENKGGEGFGLEDGTGENDVSDKIESEDQLDTAKKPGDDKDSKDEEDASCKEERGIDMSEDFDSKLQDVEKAGDDSDESDQSDNDEEADKQMGETEEGAEKLDDQIWGSDEEKEEGEEDELKDDENGKGSDETNEAHNDLDANKNDDKQQGDEKQEGLDAADDGEEKKKQQKDIDKLADPEVGDDQINPYHNELEDPPEPDDFDLGDNFNLDKEDGNDNDENNEENPFDIDAMKDKMEVDEDQNNEEETEESDIKDQQDQNVDSDSESETEDVTKKAGYDEGEDVENPENEEDKENTETPGKSEDAENDENPDTKEEDKQTDNNDYNESKDKASNEENIQATPDEKSKGSSDQVQIDQSDKDQKQDDDMDAQDTGEDKQGTGQAENEDSKSGHQGYADSKETKTNEKPKDKKFQEKRKHGNTNEERTVSDTNQKDEKKLLKTIDKLNEKEGDDSGDDEKDSEDVDEYQHIKDAKKTDKTTLDNATEEQSKQVHHQDNVEDEESGPDESKDDLMETEENLQNDETKTEEMQSEPTERKSNKPSKERNDDTCESKETIEVEGETVLTHTVLRSDETSAHCIVDILHDSSLPSEASTLDTLELRKMVEKERFNTRLVQPGYEDFETWQTISNKMLPNARELCEQLRLILEPTKCTRLKGDYRTGRRINMKKIIPYIASQFRKDKIWLRRTKAAQRDYKITIAIDDSKSMHHNNSKNLTLMAISLVSQALKFLESGSLSIVSFGEAPRIILNHTEQFDGPKLVNSLNFSQNESRIGQLLDFARVASSEDAGSGSDNGIFENLLLILSDGRNIFSEGEQYVRNSVKLARLNRIFIVYIIIDNPENKHSILDIRVPSFSADRKSLSMNSYLDSFPFPYYVIVRDLSQLPLVLSDAMRQWFELVNSEQ